MKNIDLQNQLKKFPDDMEIVVGANNPMYESYDFRKSIGACERNVTTISEGKYDYVHGIPPPKELKVKSVLLIR